MPGQHAQDGACGGSQRSDSERALERLGEALNKQTDEVLARIVKRVEESGRILDPEVEESFQRVGAVSTTAVARWMSGEGADVAREVGRESWQIFGEFGARRDAPLNEVTKRCLRWRDAAAEVLRELAVELQTPEDVLAVALGMLQRSLDVTLVRMCESFETERQRAQEQLTRGQEELSFVATHDALTGLPNRTLIIDRIEQQLTRSRRQQMAMAVLFIDLDNFKNINDTFGHRVGDSLLRTVAARLQATIRETDALGCLGGDEFVVIAEDLSLQAGPELIAERILGALAQPFELEGREDTPLILTASVGVAVGDCSSAEDLVRDAHIAMYRAKRERKGTYVIFESAMQDVVKRRAELELDLRVALERNEFFLVYQPTVDLRDMSPTGMEALIRWSHPTRGLLPPGDFIPLLEETGLINNVGRWVLEQACHQGAAWRQDGYPIRVAVNASAQQLDTDDFVTDVRAALEKSGIDPDALTIEVTETTIMRDAQETAARLAAIKALGVRIAIDDFGSGYSSLAYLQHFPVDALKIDRSFVSRLSHGHEGQTLVRTLIQLGKALSIETLAEGIECTEELSFLREEKCDSGQGFLFAHPLTIEACELFLQEAMAGQALPAPVLVDTRSVIPAE
jgi:diguanylate cyclase (GGDEF)-like protein